MSYFPASLVDELVDECFSLYNKLPKSGKPVEKEWTVLACIVKYDICTKGIEVVSLGTGSKCIGATKMSPKGDVMNDSHAEVFARRGFLLYIYDSIEKYLKNESSIILKDNGLFKLKDNIEFIFYSSQLPCGDASIMSKSVEEDNYGDTIQSMKHKVVDNICDMEIKRLKIEDDIHRTGAKCLPYSEQDTKEPGINYHLLGQVRTKPGRGDRTLSVSCSDKLAKWIHLGIQGSLLDMFCGPIYITHFIFGAGVPYCEESLKRALLNRHSVTNSLNAVPKFYQTSLKFPSIKQDGNIRPAAGSILWSKTKKPIFEVAIQGKKLGVTKKTATLPSSSLCISKYNLYKRFINIVEMDLKIKQNIFGEENITCVPYNQMKRKSSRYLEKWSEVKEQFFKIWTVKPDMWNFCINMQ